MLCIESASKKRLINLYLGWFNYNHNNIYLAKHTRIFADTRINYGTRINGSARIKGEGTVEIGKYCAIGDGLTVISSNHSIHYLNLQNALQRQISGAHPFTSEKLDVIIGHNVWIGDNVTILPGVELGNGSVIGAGSVVTKSVVDFQIAAGNPAKQIGERFNKQTAELLSSLQWWNWSVSKMRENKALFLMDFTTLNGDEVTDLLSKIHSQSE